MSAIKQDFCKDAMKEVLGGWLDIPSLLADRIKLIRLPRLIARHPKKFHNSPFQFAVKMLFVPTVLITSLAAIIFYMLNAPPKTGPWSRGGITSTINLQVVAILADGIGRPKKNVEYPDAATSAGYDKMTTAELQRSVDNKINTLSAMKKNDHDASTTESFLGLKRDATLHANYMVRRASEELVKGIPEFSQLLEKKRREQEIFQASREIEVKFSAIIVAIALLANTTVFGWGIRLLTPNVTWANTAESVHLYYVGVAMAPIACLLGLVNISAEALNRYGHFWHEELYWPLMCACVFLSTYTLTSVGGLMTNIDSSESTNPNYPAKIVFLLTGSNFIIVCLTFLAVHYIGKFFYYVFDARALG